MQRVIYLGATELEQAVIDAARAWVENSKIKPMPGTWLMDLHEAVRALNGR